MTQEHPPEPDGLIRCDECNATLDVIRKDNQTLAVTCRCDELRSIKVASVLPSGWSE